MSGDGGQGFYDDMQEAKSRGLSTQEFLLEKARADVPVRFAELDALMADADRLDYEAVSEAASRLENAAGAVVALSGEES